MCVWGTACVVSEACVRYLSSGGLFFCAILFVKFENFGVRGLCGLSSFAFYVRVYELNLSGGLRAAKTKMANEPYKRTILLP